MNDIFYEQLIKSNNTLYGKFKLFLMIFFGALLFLCSMLWPLCFIALIIYLVVSYFFIYPLLNIEYEYEMLLEDLSFDTIYNQVKRKRILTISTKNICYMGKIGNDKSKQYLNTKAKDFSNRIKDETYILVLNSGEKILFSPDDKLKEYIKHYTIHVYD